MFAVTQLSLLKTADSKLFFCEDLPKIIDELFKNVYVASFKYSNFLYLSG